MGEPTGDVSGGKAAGVGRAEEIDGGIIVNLPLLQKGGNVFCGSGIFGEVVGGIDVGKAADF